MDSRVRDRTPRISRAQPGAVETSSSLIEIKPIDVPAYVAAARRRKFLVAATTILTTAALLGLAMLMPRSYEAGTRMLIDPRGLQVMDKEVTPRTGTADQVVSVVESEMRVVTSDRVLQAVIDRQGLLVDPEFNGSKRYAWSFATDLIDKARNSVKTMLGSTQEPPRIDLVTLRKLQTATRIRREPQSFVVDLIVRSEDAEKSARLADAIAAYYLETRTQTTSGATQRASTAMSGRLDELRRRLEDAEARAQAYKRENDIVMASGRLVGEQQLSELNTQLVTARGDAARAVVRLDQIQQIRRTGVDPDGIPEALQSEAVLRLKTQYSAIRRREASLQATLLPSHPLVKQVRQEMSDARRQISEEIGRIAEAARLDVDRARNNERTLERSLTELKNLATTTNEKTAKLRELELEVEAARTLYNQFLQRGGELAEQKGLDTSLAVVLSPAVPPRAPIGLPLSLLAPAGLLAGLCFGVALAVRRDRRDPVLRGADQLPALGSRGTISVIPGLEAALAARGGILGRLRKNGSKKNGDSAAEMIPSFVLSEPDSEASRAVLRLIDDIAMAAGRAEGTTVLVTAAAAFEGKSTIAVNLALAAARAGDRVLLVDGDLERRTLTEAIDASAHLGLSDVIAGKETLSSVVLHVPTLSVDMLSAGQSTVRLAGQANRMVERAMRDLVAPYDVVVIDGGLLPHGRLLTAWAAVANETAVITRSDLSQKQAVAEALSAAAAFPGGNVRTVMIS
ncbi:MAG: GumC family protein [Hyphomicrobiaceae bacterium]